MWKFYESRRKIDDILSDRGFVGFGKTDFVGFSQYPEDSNVSEESINQNIFKKVENKYKAWVNLAGSKKEEIEVNILNKSQISIKSKFELIENFPLSYTYNIEIPNNVKVESCKIEYIDGLLYISFDEIDEKEESIRVSFK